MSPWIKGNRAAAAYIGVSLPTFKRLLRECPIRRVKLPTGAILYRSDWIDTILEQFTEETGELDRMVDKIIKERST